MPVASDETLLRVFIGEEDRYQGRPLYEAIVAEALRNGMAGATALAAPEGFGRSRHIRSEFNLDAGPRLTMVVEIVDTEERIARFLPQIDDMIESGLVTVEKVRAMRFLRRAGLKEPAVPESSSTAADLD